MSPLPQAPGPGLTPQAQLPFSLTQAPPPLLQQTNTGTFPVDFWGLGPDNRFTHFKGHLIHPRCHAMPTLSSWRTPSTQREAHTYRSAAHPGPPQTRPLSQAPVGLAFWSRQVRAPGGRQAGSQPPGASSRGRDRVSGEGPASVPPLCRPALRLRLGGPRIRVFSNESVLHIRWPKYWSFNLSISPCSEYSGLISFEMNSLSLLAVRGTLESPLDCKEIQPVHSEGDQSWVFFGRNDAKA